MKENYDITKEEGTLTVAPIDKVVVTITGKKDRTTYNGKEQNVKDYEVSISNAKYKDSVEKLSQRVQMPERIRWD